MHAANDATAPLRRPPSWRVLIALLVLCYAVAAAGAAVTLPQIGHWYTTIAKPGWTPPDALFGPVWSALYLMMALAAWLAWRAGAGLAAFFVQLALNCAWSFLFFGAHRIGLALIDIALLGLAIVATIIGFGRHRRLAAALMLPYLAWVSFAAALNLAIWRLNG